jgi:hypothetical protein
MSDSSCRLFDERTNRVLYKSVDKSVSKSMDESVTKSINKSNYDHDNIIDAVGGGCVMDTWTLLHDLEPEETSSNLTLLLKHLSVLKNGRKVKRGSKLFDIIQSAIQREYILNQYYLNLDFDKLLHSLRYELHPDATSVAVKIILIEDLLENDQIMSLFDYGLLNKDNVKYLLQEYDNETILQLFDESRWQQLVPLIDNCWSICYSYVNRKVKALMEKYAMWSWEQGYSKLIDYIDHMPNHDLHTFYCMYRDRIMSNSSLLDKEEKYYDIWFVFLSNKSNIKLLINNKDNIPIHVRIRCLIHHRLIDELIENYDMDLIMSCVTDENLSLDHIGFWIRLLSKQIWQIQKSVMSK